MKKVRAVVMTGIGNVEVQEFGYPKLEPGQMLLRIEMSGICGTDRHAYNGELVLYAGTNLERRATFPCIKGHENIGIIEEINGEYLDYYGNKLKVGDRITMCPNIICGKCWWCRNIHGYPLCPHNWTYGVTYRSDEPPHLLGGWAEYMIVLPGTFAYKVPDGMPLEVAVNAELLAGSSTLDRAKQYSGIENRGFGVSDTVVVQGAGPLGLCHMIKARVLGAGDIIAVDKSDYRLNVAKEFGANYTINVDKTTREERIQFVKDLTDGRGADVIVECVGQPQVVSEGLDMLRRAGTYIEPGNFVDTGEVGINIHRQIAIKNALIIGSSNHPNTAYERTFKIMEEYADRFPFEKFITHQFKLEECKEAMEKINDLDCMKAVFVP